MQRAKVPGAHHTFKDRRLLDALAAFLGAGEPAWFATLTFRGEPSRATCERLIREWLRELAKSMRSHFDVALGFGEQDRGVDHCHLALGRESAGLDPRDAAARWRSGDALVEPYDPALGGGAYLALHATWDRQRVCPRSGPCRNKGCAQAPGPW